MTTRLAVLYGGRSGEHAVSRRSGESILAALDRERYQITEVLIGTDGGWHVDGRPTPLPQALRVVRAQDVVFPALHGPYGEDGTVASLLDGSACRTWATVSSPARRAWTRASPSASSRRRACGSALG